MAGVRVTTVSDTARNFNNSGARIEAFDSAEAITNFEAYLGQRDIDQAVIDRAVRAVRLFLSQRAFEQVAASIENEEL